MKVAFLATPLFSAPTLRALVKAGHECHVFTALPKKRGRGHKIQPSPIAMIAGELGLTVETPQSHDDIDLKDFDVGVVVAFGMILPERVLNAPKYGCINGHASLLPRWRGAAPIERAIEAGDKKTGVCIMDMVRELDAGDVILRQEIVIERHDNAETLYEKLSQLTADLMVKVLDMPKPWPRAAQDEVGITYAHKITPNIRQIDWEKSPQDILNHIQAFYPHAWTTLGDERVKVLSAYTKNGEIVLDRIKPAGKPEMDYQAFMRSRHAIGC